MGRKLSDPGQTSLLQLDFSRSAPGYDSADTHGQRGFMTDDEKRGEIVAGGNLFHKARKIHAGREFLPDNKVSRTMIDIRDDLCTLFGTFQGARGNQIKTAPVPDHPGGDSLHLVPTLAGEGAVCIPHAGRRECLRFPMPEHVEVHDSEMVSGNISISPPPGIPANISGCFRPAARQEKLPNMPFFPWNPVP